MFWMLFGSEKRVEQALNQSVGYDISPKDLKMPANTDKPASGQSGSKLSLDNKDAAIDLKYKAFWEDDTRQKA